MPGAVAAEEPATTAGDAEVRQQLHRVLEHGAFRNSRRCRAFLQFVVEEKLNGRAQHLKERLIGVAVFQQAPDYDTNANSVVRVTAGEVRRRLAQYYGEAGAGDALQIELPLGSYVPEFLPCCAEAHPAVVEGEPVAAGLVPANVGETLPIAELQGRVLAVPARRSSPRPGVVWALLLALGTALLGAGLLAGLLLQRPTRANAATDGSDRLWKGAFGSGNVLLCVGTSDPPVGVSFTTAKAAATIGSAIGHAGGSVALVPMQDMRVEDLQRSPAVLIGAFNNVWTMRLQTPLQYQFLQAPGMANAIVNTQDPKAARFATALDGSRDYGLFAHFKSPATGQSTVIAAGLGQHGTAAVRLFLSSPELLETVSRTAPRGWEKGNYEVVLASDRVNNYAYPPKVVAAVFW